MSSLNISVLGAARETYTEQLRLHLTPLIYQGFVCLYEDAKIRESETHEFGNELKQFQILLRDIPYWNQSVLEKETERILDAIDFLMDLVAIIFVSHAKILYSVRVGGNGKNIRIKLPTSEIFIHSVYCKAAEMIYYNPQSFRNYHLRDHEEKIIEMLNKSITNTINMMIPIEHILKEFISKTVSEHVKENPNSKQPYQEPEIPGQLLTEEQLGLDNDNDGGSVSSVSTINDDFGAGGGDDAGSFEEVDDFLNDEIAVGKDALPDDDPFKNDPLVDIGADLDEGRGGSSGLKFKDDDTIFTSQDDKPVFKDLIEDDPFGTIDTKKDEDDPFSSKTTEDPFSSKTTEDDPFKTTGSDDFKDLGPDPFKSSSNDTPSPPELSDETFAPKKDEINFFEDLP